jgi:hypothetical protein
MPTPHYSLIQTGRKDSVLPIRIMYLCNPIRQPTYKLSNLLCVLHTLTVAQQVPVQVRSLTRDHNNMYQYLYSNSKYDQHITCTDYTTVPTDTPTPPFTSLCLCRCHLSYTMIFFDVPHIVQ